MTKKPEKPDESELLAFLDEELTAERQAEIRQMLAANWELRAQLARLEKRIEQYVEATAHQAEVATPSVDDLWKDFSLRLSAKEPASALQRRGNAMFYVVVNRLLRWRRTLLPTTLRWEMASGVAVSLLMLTAFAMLMWRAERTVSAHELLQRSTQAENATLKQVAEPVVYRKLQVRRTGVSEAVLWESWNDARRNQFRQRVADQHGLRFLRANEKTSPALIAELEAIWRANHFDLQRPLSAAAFAEWRKTIQTKAESVTEIALPDNSAGLKLITTAEAPYAVNAIITAALIVRRSDWHVVAQHLQVQGEKEIRAYELSETAYQVLPLEALTVFADLAPTPSPFALVSPSASPTSVNASPAPSRTAMPTEAALREAEVAALYTLHQAQADLGEQIEVVRDPTGLIEVRGLVETAARKRQLIEALKPLALVTVRLQAVEEIAQQAAPPPTGVTEIVPASEGVPPVAPGANAFEKKLGQYFAAQGESQKNIGPKIAELSNAVIAEASAAQSEAWALRRLAERFSSEKERELSPAARQQMMEIMQHHSTRLRARVRQLQARLEPVLSAISGERVTSSPASLPNESTWQTQALTAFKAVERVRQLAGRLFTATDGMAETPEQAARQMLEAVVRLDGTLEALERQITK